MDEERGNDRDRVPGRFHDLGKFRDGTARVPAHIDNIRGGSVCILQVAQAFEIHA